MATSPDEQNLAGRVAVVTGGSRGIGRDIATMLAERGAAVGVAFQQREGPARELEASVRASGGRADLSDPLHVEIHPDRLADVTWRSGAHPAVGTDRDGCHRAVSVPVVQYRRLGRLCFRPRTFGDVQTRRPIRPRYHPIR